MVLDLAEPFGLGVLDDRDVFHHRIPSIPRASAPNCCGFAAA
jgi:hypothetical protein